MERRFHAEPKRFSVKITIFLPDSPIADDTVYFRYALPMDTMLRYQWYFEYLAALLKVRHPRRRVKLEYFNVTDAKPEDCAECGGDYVRTHLPKRLAAKRKELGKYTKEHPQDLFGFTENEMREKAEKVRAQIRDLEAGTYDAWVPPTYINKVKEWLR